MELRQGPDLQSVDIRADDLRLSKTRGAGERDSRPRLETSSRERLRVVIRLVATVSQSLKMEAKLVSSTVKAGREPTFSIRSLNCWNWTSMAESFISTLISSRMMLRLLMT